MVFPSFPPLFWTYSHPSKQTLQDVALSHVIVRANFTRSFLLYNPQLFPVSWLTSKAKFVLFSCSCSSSSLSLPLSLSTGFCIRDADQGRRKWRRERGGRRTSPKFFIERDDDSLARKNKKKQETNLTPVKTTTSKKTMKKLWKRLGGGRKNLSLSLSKKSAKSVSCFNLICFQFPPPTTKFVHGFSSAAGFLNLLRINFGFLYLEVCKKTGHRAGFSGRYLRRLPMKPCFLCKMPGKCS